MPILDAHFRTISCDNCDKSVTYNMAEQKETFDAEGNEWMKTVRQITTLDQRPLAYCSDVCEVEGIKTGSHNLPEPKKIVTGGASAEQIKIAAQAAEAAKKATEAIKSGRRIS